MPCIKKSREAGTPAVTVIVPVFNGKNTIERALDSVFAQAFTDFEIIVVDDGSTDLTVEAISRKYGEQLRIIEHRKNRGAAAARNTGIAAARGRWVAFLDCDDTWRPDKLASQLEMLEKAGSMAKACATGFQLYKNGREITFKTKFSPEQFRREILFGCTISPGSTILVDRSVFDDIGMFDESFLRLEDWDWLLRFAKRYDMMFVPTPLADIYVGTRPRQQDTSKIENALDCIRRKHLSQLPMLASMRLRGHCWSRRQRCFIGLVGQFRLARILSRRCSSTPSEMLRSFACSGALSERRHTCRPNEGEHCRIFLILFHKRRKVAHGFAKILKLPGLES